MVYVEAQFLNKELSFLHKIDKRKCYLYNTNEIEYLYKVREL